MRSQPHIRRTGLATAAVVAGLALAAPGTHARPIDDCCTLPGSLSEEEVPVSRGQGPPRPEPTTGAGPELEWVAGAVGAGALLAGAVLVVRRRERTAA